MSHIVTIKGEFKDPRAVDAACRRLAIARPFRGTAEVFMEKKTGLIVKPKGWLFPVVIDTNTGEIAYDNYEGTWGKTEELNRFKQAYAIEKARIEATAKGYRIAEKTLEDGSIVLEILTR